MRVSGKHRIKCDREQVWDNLMDIKFLGKVTPGGKRFSQIGRHKYKGTLSVPILGKIKVTLTQKNINEAKSFRLNVYSKGHLNGDLDFKLEQMGKYRTELRYEGDLKFKRLPGFVTGEIKKKLKKAIYRLCTTIEKECKHKAKHSRISDTDELARDFGPVQSQFEQELGDIIGKAKAQFEAELADLVARSSSQLKVELMELVRKVENQRQEENDHAH